MQTHAFRHKELSIDKYFYIPARQSYKVCKILTEKKLVYVPVLGKNGPQDYSSIQIQKPKSLTKASDSNTKNR